MIKKFNEYLESKENKKLVIIIHGWGGSPKNDWMSWLSKNLKPKYDVICPKMPHTNTPIVEEWLNTIEKIVKENKDKEICFVGHSLGCNAILKYLEKTNMKVDGAIFVSPAVDEEWVDYSIKGGNFDESGNEEKDLDIVKPWSHNTNFKKIKNNIGFSYTILSTDDPYIPYDIMYKKFGENLNTEIITIKNAGHLNSEAHCTKIPILLKLIKENF